MLKPSDPPQPGAPGSERPVGELVHQLIEDGKAYARAEAGFVKAVASSKASALKVPAILLAGALLLLIAALAGLAVGVTMALATLIGPLAGGLVTFLIFGGLAGALAWSAVQRIRSDL